MKVAFNVVVEIPDDLLDENGGIIGSEKWRPLGPPTDLQGWGIWVIDPATHQPPQKEQT